MRCVSVEDDDRYSDGWLCDRGRYNIGFYASPERLTQPLYRHDGSFVQIGWDDALAMWARSIREANGAAGAIGGGRLLNEEAFLLQHVFRAIGVRNIDWRAGRQLQASTPTQSEYAQLENAQAIVVAGQSPAELAPVMWLRAIKAVTRFGAAVVRIAPNEDPPKFPHVDVANVREAASKVQAGARVAVLWDGVDLALGEELQRTFAGASFFISSEQPNARGAESMGVLPADGGLDTLAMFDAACSGTLSSLSLFGVNPVRNGRDGELARAALRRANFVVVSELFMTETAEMADLVLPAKGAFEKSGTTMNLLGDLLPVNASLKAPEGVLSDLELLIGLAQQFDLTLPSLEELDAEIFRRAAAPVAGSLGDPRYRSSIEARPDRAGRKLWDGGGTSRFDERVRNIRNEEVLA
jgi:predicted molibdopterin-dependent oxidoreductase YjgC